MASATEAERTLWEDLDKEKYVKARDEADAVLANNPDSFIGNWAMAIVHHDELSNHARALFFLKRAEEILAKKYGNPPERHRKALIEEYEILSEMDENQAALLVLDRYDALYAPKFDERRVWPLFKLGRIDEARRMTDRLMKSDDWNARMRGYNGRLALESEANHRAAAYRFAIDGIAATGERSCVLFGNAADTATTMFRLREAEELALKAVKAPERDCPQGEYNRLAQLYLMMGEFQKSLSAIESLKKTKLEKRYRAHYGLNARILTADLAYALGRVEDAERMAVELQRLPERTGMVSGSKSKERLARTVRTYVALDARANLLAERRSYRPWLDPKVMSADAMGVALAKIEASQILIQLAADGALQDVVRPNLTTVWTWQVGSLTSVLGSGVMRSAISAGRALDREQAVAASYFDALEAEVVWRGGEFGVAAALCGKALAGLPKEEALLHWRAQAIYADSMWRLGWSDVARPHYREVLQKFPSILRILDLRVPVTFAADGTALAKRALERLRGSRRFDESNSPLRVQVNSDKGGLTVCLLDENGYQFSCTTTDKVDEQNTDTILAALDAFHEAAFSPKVSLTQSDLSSLDGSPTRRGAGEVLKDVLGP